MGWRDTLLNNGKASFRGVEFFVDRIQNGFGRRNIVHQFPKSDDIFTEDLGRLADTFRVTGFVIQTEDNEFNYIAERNELRDALRQSGAGAFIHPSLGSFDVVVTSANESETFVRNSGIARFEITFTQAKDEEFLVAEVNPVKLVDYQADISWDLNLDAFADAFALDLPSFSQLDLVSDLTAISAAAKKAVNGVFNSLASAKAEALGTITNLVSTFTLVVNSPCQLGDTIEGMIGAIGDVAGLAGESVTSGILGACSGRERGGGTAPKNLYDTASSQNVTLSEFGQTTGDVTEVQTTSLETAQQYANQQGVLNLAAQKALIDACQMAVRDDYGSYEDAQDKLNEISDAIEAHVDILGAQVSNASLAAYNVSLSNDTAVESMESLRSSFAKGMEAIGAKLATVEDYVVPPGVQTTLTLAYEKYKDVSRDSEIEERNRIACRHPGFIDGGTTIEVLSE